MKIKTTGTPPNGNTWSYGADHMRAISKATARTLCGMYPLPAMGSETLVAISRDRVHRLRVQNVSGSFFVASTTAKVAQWSDVFGIEVVEATARS